MLQNIFVNTLQVCLYITLYLCLYADVIDCLRLFSGCTVISSCLMQSHLGLRCPVTPWIAVAVIYCTMNVVIHNCDPKVKLLLHKR